MNDELTAKLAPYGIDYVDAMDRMGGDEAIYKKLAMKYLNNTNYVDLVAAMEAKNYDDAYEAAHTLKGVSGNLSFTDLFKIAAAISNALYQGEYQAAEGMMADVKKEHEKVLDGLVKWQDDAL